MVVGAAPPLGGRDHRGRRHGLVPRPRPRGLVPLRGLCCGRGGFCAPCGCADGRDGPAPSLTLVGVLGGFRRDTPAETIVVACFCRRQLIQNMLQSEKAQDEASASASPTTRQARRRQVTASTGSWRLQARRAGGDTIARSAWNDLGRRQLIQNILHKKRALDAASSTTRQPTDSLASVGCLVVSLTFGMPPCFPTREDGRQFVDEMRAAQTHLTMGGEPIRLSAALRIRRTCANATGWQRARRSSCSSPWAATTTTANPSYSFVRWRSTTIVADMQRVVMPEKGGRYTWHTSWWGGGQLEAAVRVPL